MDSNGFLQTVDICEEKIEVTFKCCKDLTEPSELTKLRRKMAIAFYCEDEDPKVMFGGSYGYHQQSYQSQHSVAVGQQHAGTGEGTTDENNNNCALHGSNNGGGGDGESGVSGGEQQSSATMVNSSNRQLMRVLHQVLYRYTMEGVLSPAQTSCVFCNRLYYLFQLLY